MEPLPEGTVKFEDISKDTFQGTVEKVFSRAKRQEPLNGKILYSTNDGTSELPYGEKDVLGEFTILPGDVVGFKIATGKRLILPLSYLRRKLVFSRVNSPIFSPHNILIICKDRRDSLKRATEINLIKEIESANGGNVRERVGNIMSPRHLMFFLLK